MDFSISLCGDMEAFVHTRLLLLLILPLLSGCLAGVPFFSPSATETPVSSAPQLNDADLAAALFVPDADTEELAEPVSNGSADEVAEVETPDPETLDDNQLLSVTGDEAPEDEGQTLACVGVSDDFPVVCNKKVEFFIEYYTGRGRSVFTRWLERSTRYLPLMREIFAEEGLPRDLAYLAMVESGFNVKAYSWAHAVGPWQFIKGTGRLMKLKADWWYDERRDFEKSTRAAARYLKSLNAQFDGEWYLAVAAYNAGPGKIRTAVRKSKSRDFWVLSRGRHLRTETKDYVPKLMAALTIARDPESYGFTDLEYQQPFDYDVVTIPTVTDLEIIAKMTGADYELLKELNPELMRWSTPPDAKDYRLRIPSGTADAFLAAYAQLPKSQRANYLHYRIRSGDTLLAIAQHHHVRVDDIVRLNNIRNPRVLRIGTDLVLPLNKNWSQRPVAELQDDYIKTRRQVYTVRNGDSLWSISQRFGVTEQQLRVWNRLGWSNVIRPGQRLVVSAKAVKPGKSASRAAAKPKVAGPTHKVVYKVRQGDTLWGISRQFSVATSQIRDWNNLSDNHVLKPGDKLTLHVPGAEQRG